MLRRAIQISLAAESEGIARAARVATLAKILVERAPNDAWARLVLARALAMGGDKATAVKRLAEVEALAESTTLGAEAQRGRIALEDPQVSLEIDAVLRAAYAAASEDLETIASRARGLATRSGAWHAWFAVGIAERRRERWRPAREAFMEAIRVAPGCTPAHMEVVSAHIALGDGGARRSITRPRVLARRRHARTLAVLATALLACGQARRGRRRRSTARSRSTPRTKRTAPSQSASAPAAPRYEARLARLRDIFTRFRRK